MLKKNGVFERLEAVFPVRICVYGMVEPDSDTDSDPDGRGKKNP
jgi:hypothetical protein